ncbi:MAG: [acyl-carrier-protein] S-malonyltransferase [Rhodospirillales bacterium]|nr:[acyl-carrier-protein] S-malonyltransferase [Rhodospirillales bacterium]
MRRALVFPGQGAQEVGMGRALAEAFATARDVFDEIDEALKQNLQRLMFEGPEVDLKLTENAQPALMAVSLAVVRVLERDVKLSVPNLARFVAGHSLGEYSALAAAGSFTLADAARLLKRRGRAMQEAVPVDEGAMAALIGVELDAAKEIAAAAAENEVCVVANDNCPGQVVISGDSAAVDRALQIAAEKGFRRSVRLQVSAPFHCPLLKPAADAVAEALESITLRMPQVPLISNVTARPITDPDEIRRRLVEQTTAMVRWRESVLCMKEENIEQVVEVGAGKVLTGLLKRIDRELSGVTLGTPADIDAFAKTI